MTQRRARPASVDERERPADAVVKSGARLDRCAAGQVVRVGARLRSARAVSAARRVRDAVRVGSRISAKSRGPMRRSARCSIGCRGLGASDAGRRDGRSRREPRRARRADAQPVRLRGDAPRSADRRASSARHGRRRREGACRSTRRCATWICCRRSWRRPGAGAPPAFRAPRCSTRSPPAAGRIGRPTSRR